MKRNVGDKWDGDEKPRTIGNYLPDGKIEFLPGCGLTEEQKAAVQASSDEYRSSDPRWYEGMPTIDDLLGEYAPRRKRATRKKLEHAHA